MNAETTRLGHSARGQILPLFVLAVFALFAMVALVVDGGNLFAQQRIAQNAADAAAYAGALKVAENLAEPGSRTDAQVANAVLEAAGQNPGSGGDGVNRYAAVYTDGFGKPLVPTAAVGGGTIPAEARGVNVVGTRDVSTTFAKLPPINQATIPATAEATAVAGVLVGPCPPDTQCAVLPITMPVSIGTTICDEDLNSLGMANPVNSWKTITDPTDPLQTTETNMAVLPLCVTASGDFSLLDLGPANLAREIDEPSGQDFLVPGWIQAQTGNADNAVEDNINAYQGTTVLIPMWQALCGENPGTIDDTCERPTVNGNNTWYAVPYMRPLYLEGAYTSGNNRDDCSVPGVTWPSETGSNTVPGLIGCVKGWWLDTTVVGGPIDPNRPIDEDAVIGVQLVK